MSHIVIARTQADVVTSWRRLDFTDDGVCRMAIGLSDNLGAQIDTLLGSPISSDVTITPRGADGYAEASPDAIAVADHMTAVIFCPIGQAGADHASNLWVRLVCAPARGFCAPVPGSEFASQTLTRRLRDYLSEAETKAFLLPSCRSEVWVRPYWSAAQIFPLIWPGYVQKSGAAPMRADNLTPAELADRKRRNALAKKASHQYDKAQAFNVPEAKRHAAEVVAAARAERKKKP